MPHLQLVFVLLACFSHFVSSANLTFLNPPDNSKLTLQEGSVFDIQWTTNFTYTSLIVYSGPGPQGQWVLKVIKENMTQATTSWSWTVAQIKDGGSGWGWHFDVRNTPTADCTGCATHSVPFFVSLLSDAASSSSSSSTKAATTSGYATTSTASVSSLSISTTRVPTTISVAATYATTSSSATAAGTAASTTSSITSSVTTADRQTLKLGLGLGLGLGLPLLTIVTILVTWACVRRRRSIQMSNHGTLQRHWYGDDMQPESELKESILFTGNAKPISDHSQPAELEAPHERHELLGSANKSELGAWK